MRESFQVPLSSLTTLKLGGPATRLVRVESEDELAALLTHDTPFFLLGGGSNLVVSDQGFAGTVAQLAMQDTHITEHGDKLHVEVGAGALWDDLVERLCSEGVRGLECLSGIPGQVGATPIQNVGAYGQEVSETLVWVRVFDRQERAFQVLDAAACGFAYRHSIFKNNPRFIVTRVCFALSRSTESSPIRYAELAKALGVSAEGRAPLQLVRDTVIALRRQKGMVVDPNDPESQSAGSFFTNAIVSAEKLTAIEARVTTPVPWFVHGDAFKVPAAWLVEQAGFVKGTRRGAVGVSKKHALALVNYGGTAEDLVALARAIVQGVREKFDVTLIPEPVFVGMSL